jgi:signal transduction histidine kinase
MGTLPYDTEKEKLHKRFLIYVALLMNGGGFLWATICVYYGLYLPAAVPLSYIVMTVANLRLFSRTKRFGLARSFQLLISLVLPFVFQWSLGGFVPSGSVMLWAMTAILGALTFQEIRITLRWYLGYLVLTVLTGVIDGDVSRFTSPASSTPEATLFVVNIIGVSIIVFGLMIYFVRSNELAYEELELKNAELVDSQAQLVQAEKMASIGSLTAGLAHEMNTPVGVINSNTDVSGRCIAAITEALENCQTVAELGSNDQFQRSLTLLQTNNKATLDSSARITKLVNSLTSFARLDEATFQKADLHEGLESTLNLIGHEFKDRIDVVREYGDIPPVVCHPGELNQVFVNLLRNAVEAIENSGKITIRSFVGSDDVRVQIEDSGVGIAPEQLRRIFDPTFTRRAPRVRAGLGLFSSYQIVRKHKGEIRIESEPGKGTSVTVILPTAQEDPPALRVQQM